MIRTCIYLLVSWRGHTEVVVASLAGFEYIATIYRIVRWIEAGRKKKKKKERKERRDKVVVWWWKRNSTNIYDYTLPAHTRSFTLLVRVWTCYIVRAVGLLYYIKIRVCLLVVSSYIRLNPFVRPPVSSTGERLKHARARSCLSDFRRLMMLTLHS